MLIALVLSKSATSPYQLQLASRFTVDSLKIQFWMFYKPLYDICAKVTWTNCCLLNGFQLTCWWVTLRELWDSLQWKQVSDHVNSRLLLFRLVVMHASLWLRSCFKELKWKLGDLQSLLSANYGILEITLKGSTPDLSFLNQFILSALPAYSKYYITTKFCIGKTLQDLWK